jgi:hypothetical protein
LTGLNSQCSTASEAPDLFTRLLDLMTQVPPILEAFDALVMTNANKAAERTFLIRLLQQCTTLHAQLLAWCEDLREQIQGPLYWSVPSVARNPADAINDRIFPLAFHFPTLSIAQLLLLYWSTLIVLYRTTQDIDKRLRSNKTEASFTGSNSRPRRDVRGNDQRSDYNCPSNTTISPLANKICQSFEFCYHSSNGTLGVQSTVFPRWVAHKFYASDPEYGRKFAWCEEIHKMTAPDSRFDLKIMKLGNCAEFAV